jgi:hypothetical protein
MTSIVLLEEFQSLGTVQLVPEVRKMTIGSAARARCGPARSAREDARTERSRREERRR